MAITAAPAAEKIHTATQVDRRAGKIPGPVSGA
jgi:hypothetical protein